MRYLRTILTGAVLVSVAAAAGASTVGEAAPASEEATALPAANRAIGEGLVAFDLGLLSAAANPSFVQGDALVPAEAPSGLDVASALPELTGGMPAGVDVVLLRVLSTGQAGERLSLLAPDPEGYRRLCLAGALGRWARRVWRR